MSTSKFPALLYVVKPDDGDEFLGVEEVDDDRVEDGDAVAVYELQSVKTASKRSILVD